MFRQIAGMVARRIVSYARVGHRVEQNSQCGFIKFGSRVDLFLPLESPTVRVKLGDKVVGTQTPDRAAEISSMFRPGYTGIRSPKKEVKTFLFFET